MKPKTQQLWSKQDQHEGDRLRLFSAVALAVPATNIMYAGSYVDVAPSFVFPAATYVDSDRRAAAFFADVEGVDEIIAAHGGAMPSAVRFIHSDYNSDLGLDDGQFDLLVSLYAGLISATCTRYLRVGGTLLVNGSHGDADLASIDPRYELSAVIRSRSGDYSVTSDNLDTYMVPKKEQEITVETIRASGRGVAYTKPVFAYLFTRVS